MADQDDEVDFLTPTNTQIAGLAALEGIPVAAIGRMLMQPFGRVYDTLKDLRARGVIAIIPKSDWKPGVLADNRMPCFSQRMSEEDLQFACQKEFRLTNLMAGFFSMLLRHDHVSKAQLHTVIENQRAIRGALPDDATDPKMVDVVICNLRKRLKKIDSTVTIATVWGQGYYIEKQVREYVLAKIGVPHVPEEVSAGRPTTASGSPPAPAVA